MSQDLSYFQELKNEVVQKVKESTHVSSDEISDWTGQDIKSFQQHMQEALGGVPLSERWFYTHMKVRNNEKLPSIGSLNTLCKYTGYKGWHDFLHHQRNRAPIREIEQDNRDVFKPSEEHEYPNTTRKPPNWLKQKSIIFSIIFILTVILIKLSLEWIDPTVVKYQFCFIDSDSKQPITGMPIELSLLYENESPKELMGDKNGCVELSIIEDTIKYIIKAGYYHADTVTRTINKEQSKELIPLQKDIYAALIHTFSTSKAENWEKRKQILNNIIASDAKIIQVDIENERYTELYTKKEFINLMTVLIRSFKNIEIISIIYNSKGEIFKMRFTQHLNQEK